ncbi:MAG: lipid-A-disaccharide synthase [Planctomycetota bacterium]
MNSSCAIHEACTISHRVRKRFDDGTSTSQWQEAVTQNLFFSVGEPSGDQHAARLIAALQSHGGVGPELPWKIRGFGGPAMQQAGCELDVRLTDHAVVGIVEVLPKIRQFLGFADRAEAAFRAGDVDGVVLVDFPGFNWHIAKRANKFDIPVFYYCPPQLWAWGSWRLRKMQRYVDHVISVLPFEADYFSAAGLDTVYVGHPFFDATAEQQLDASVVSMLSQKRAPEDTLVAVLPGSRDHEVHENFPLMLETIRRLHRSSDRLPSTRFAIAAYRDAHCLWCRDQLRSEDGDLPLEFFVGKTSEIIEAADCGMMVSGSVSLEMMARNTPAAVIYRVGRLTHAIAKRLVRIDSMTLPNLMCPQKLFPEFVSVGDTSPAVEFLEGTLRSLIGDPYYRDEVATTLGGLAARYAVPGASHAAAQAIRERMPSSRQTIPWPGGTRPGERDDPSAGGRAGAENEERGQTKVRPAA